jgi:hypothetical protein
VLEKVFYTSVLVGDQDETPDFYTNIVGLEKPTPDGPRFLTVGVEGDAFCRLSGAPAGGPTWDCSFSSL